MQLALVPALAPALVLETRPWCCRLLDVRRGRALVDMLEDDERIAKWDAICARVP